MRLHWVTVMVGHETGHDAARRADTRCGVGHFNGKDEYTAIFTLSASGALKLVGESYPFDRGWSVLLDAAAFVPTNRLDLGAVAPDFVVISFYKMVGYPTRVGCLLIRNDVVSRLRRPWFADGTVNFATVSRTSRCRASSRPASRRKERRRSADRSDWRAILPTPSVFCGLPPGCAIRTRPRVAGDDRAFYRRPRA